MFYLHQKIQIIAKPERGTTMLKGFKEKKKKHVFASQCYLKARREKIEHKNYSQWQLFSEPLKHDNDQFSWT